MNVAKAGAKGPALPTGSMKPGTFSWATIYEFGEKEAGKPKSVVIDGALVYTGSSSDGVKRYNATSGG
jgi:hypothetical protein